MSKCLLLEDGRPLPVPRALHATIRGVGKGSYSHWTAGSLYFSTSDNSDPRTNGRKYSLVSNREVVEHTTRLAITQAQATCRVLSGKRAIKNRRLIIRNIDPDTAIIPRLSLDGWPDLSSSEGILRSILKPGMSDEEKSLAIWKFLVDWRYHHYPAEQGDEVHDPVRFINVYGYGFCDDSARNTAALAQLAGLRARVWGLSGHVVAETYYDGGWHMFDPDHEVFYRTAAGHIASVEELARNPGLITKTKRDPIGSDTRSIARLYTSTEDNSVREKKIPATHLLRPVLQPGDEVVFAFESREKIHRTAFSDRPLPPAFGNGTLSRVLDLPDRESTVSIDWPYVILDAELNFPSKGTEPLPQFAAAIDGKVFEKIPVIRRTGNNVVQLADWLKLKNRAVYRFQLRVTRDSMGSGLQQIPLRVDFQFAPRAVAQIQRGETSFHIR
ncbi:MAG: transglutaminase domain-containing protein, partial [Limisphaerales bacterium]